MYVALTRNDRVISSGDLYCCLLPLCEALRTCRSGFPIATIRSKTGYAQTNTGFTTLYPPNGFTVAASTSIFPTWHGTHKVAIPVVAYICPKSWWWFLPALFGPLSNFTRYEEEIYRRNCDCVELLFWSLKFCQAMCSVTSNNQVKRLHHRIFPRMTMLYNLIFWSMWSPMFSLY